ncbi:MULTISPECIES: hypothetical protein [Burkholderia]|nr:MULTISPECIES: hypothetical protein [Burkholderia]QVN14303.1 hypothetical protein JYG37_28075 [Burkholderia sp. LAS2]
MGDQKQVMCIEQTADHWLAGGRRGGVEAALRTAWRGGRDWQGRLAGLQKRARIISRKYQKPF